MIATLDTFQQPPPPPQPSPTQEHFVQVGDIYNNCRTAQLVAAEAREKFDYKSPIEIWPGRPDFMKKKVMRVIR